MPATGLLSKADARQARFWDRAAKAYSESPISDMQSYRHKLALTQQYLRPEMRVVEFGCGTGSIAIEHARHVRHLTAVDVSSEMLAIAKKRAMDANIRNLGLRHSSIEGFDAPDHSYHAVMMLSLLHLLDDPRAALEKAWRLLKPGGLLVTNTACLGDNMRWFGLIAPAGAALGLIPRVQIFSVEELRDKIADHGFERLEEFQQGDGRTYFQIARKIA